MVDCDVVEVDSVAELRDALTREYGVLVLSAHGVSIGNRHGLMCGREPMFGDEIDVLPPVVCLSACSVSPRGVGTVNIADLMFRHGARVVLGTLVPVDVRRNAILMTRLFANMAEALHGRGSNTTFEGVWHFTQLSNAVNDILSGNDQLSSWASQGSREEAVIYQFMSQRSAGRLRKSHIYDDTEAVLCEMVRERGLKGKFQAWLTTPGYLPESLLYVVLGAPDRIVFNDPMFTASERRLGARVDAWLAKSENP
ncbi:MAG: CHAT domain-containing protein [bacterium]